MGSGTTSCHVQVRLNSQSPGDGVGTAKCKVQVRVELPESRGCGRRRLIVKYRLGLNSRSPGDGGDGVGDG